MAFFDKLNDFAKNIGDKTTDAIETGKLNSRINAEKAAAGEELKKIGQHYYSLFMESGEAAPEVLEFCQAAKSHFDAAADAQAQIDRIRAENEAEKAAAAAPTAPASPQLGTVVCSCGASNPEGTKFCRECGAKLEAPPAAPMGNVCPACGTANPEGTKFCRECGGKLEMPAAPQPKICACGTEVAPGVKFCPECGNRMEV